MKTLIVVVMCCTAAASLCADQFRTLTIRDWLFAVPTFLTEHTQEGPDFTVTSLISKERNMSLGIYAGGWPKEFSKGKNNVRNESEQIAGQKVTWSLWEESADGKESFHAEVYLLINPALQQSEKLHIFALAASVSDLNMLRQSVRAARRNNQP